MNNHGLLLVAVIDELVVDNLGHIKDNELKIIYDHSKEDLTSLFSRLPNKIEFRDVKWILTSFMARDRSNDQIREHIIVCANKVSGYNIIDYNTILLKTNLVSNKNAFILNINRMTDLDEQTYIDTWEKDISDCIGLKKDGSYNMATITLYKYPYIQDYLKMCDFCFGKLRRIKSNFHVCTKCNRIDRQQSPVSRTKLSAVQNAAIDKICQGSEYKLSSAFSDEVDGIMNVFEDFNFPIDYYMDINDDTIIFIDGFPVITGGIPYE